MVNEQIFTMTKSKKQIRETLKWKKHPSYCAEKLNITESQYKKIKKASSL